MEIGGRGKGEGVEGEVWGVETRGHCWGGGVGCGEKGTMLGSVVWGVEARENGWGGGGACCDMGRQYGMGRIRS